MSRLAALSEALGLGPDPTAILDPLARFCGEVDAELERASRGLELPCKPGCDACCHESVFVSAPELLAVAAELFATRTEAELAQILDAMLAAAARFEDELELLEHITGPERDEVAARVKFRCPLLSSDGRCGVYAARELNARSFGHSVDGAEPYGCTLTHARLAVIDPRPALPDARALRRRLAETIPGTEVVHVYPWWFRRYRRFFAPEGSG